MPLAVGPYTPSRTRVIRALVILCAAVGLPLRAAGAEVRVTRAMLATVTDTTAILTWQTDQPANTIVRYGMSESQLDKTASTNEPVRFHYCGLRDLRPGTAYHYVVQSGETLAATSLQSPGRFTTLAPPPGSELFAFATLTDTHVGEQQVGRLALGPDKVISKGVQWREPNMPHWQLTLTAAIDEINQRDAAFTIIKGDITHAGRPDEYAAAKRLLDRLARPYHIVHGNHDRWEPLRRTFNLDQSYSSFDREGIHFVILDTELLAGEPGPPSQTQLAWLARDLGEHREQPTFVFLHRPVLPNLQRSVGPLAERLYKFQRDAAVEQFGPGAGRLLDLASGRIACVPEPRARQLAELLAAHGRVAGVFAGHLHRNYVGRWPALTGNLPYVETASTKEYPCGYAITRVFTGGYLHAWHPLRDPRCLEWSATTEDVYARLAWTDKAGTLADRCFVVPYDALTLTPHPQEKPRP